MKLVFVILLLALVWGLWWLGRHPWVWQQWLMKRFLKRMERQVRQKQQAASKARSETAGGKSDKPVRREPVIPPEYAQDVEFTETRVFTSREEVTAQADADGYTEVSLESQVSDVEWVEIRNKPKQKPEK